MSLRVYVRLEEVGPFGGQSYTNSATSEIRIRYDPNNVCELYVVPTLFGLRPTNHIDTRS